MVLCTYTEVLQDLAMCKLLCGTWEIKMFVHARLLIKILENHKRMRNTSAPPPFAHGCALPLPTPLQYSFPACEFTQVTRTTKLLYQPFFSCSWDLDNWCEKQGQRICEEEFWCLFFLTLLVTKFWTPWISAHEYSYIGTYSSPKLEVGGVIEFTRLDIKEWQMAAL